MNFDIHIDRLLRVDPQEFLENATGVINLTTHDGVVTTINHRELAFALFVAKLHRVFNAPFLSTHLPMHYYGKFGMTSKTFTEWTNVIMWDVYDHALPSWPNHRKLFELICKTFIEVVGDVYIALVGPTRQYMRSVSLIECYRIYNHPKMKALRDGVKKTPASVNGTIAAMNKLLTSDPDLNDNLSMICKASAVRVNQVVQCLGLVGYRAEVDGSVFAEPLLTTYLEGLNTTYSYMVESRTSSTAVLATQQELQSNEYASRQTVLGLVSVYGIEGEDCGTTRLMDWYVVPSDDHVYIHHMKGTWYINEHGVYDFIRGDEYHLEGTVIKVRTSLSCLHVRTRGRVCRKCYGKSSESHPPHFHLGYISSVDGYSRGSQHSISKKHSIGSASVVLIPLSEYESKYLHTKAGNTSDYFVTDRVLKHNASLVIEHSSARGLHAVMAAELQDSTEEAVSALSEIHFNLQHSADESEMIGINTSLLKHRAHLSYEMLQYARQYRDRITLDQNGYYHIPLDHWKAEWPLLVMPAVSTAEAVDHDALYESVGGRVAALRKRGVVTTAAGITKHLFDILSKSGCLLCDVATTALSVLSEDPSQGLFVTGVTGLDSQPTSLRRIIFGKSASVTQQYERQHQHGYNPLAMLPLGRLAAATDTIMVPDILNMYRRNPTTGLYEPKPGLIHA